MDFREGHATTPAIIGSGAPRLPISGTERSAPERRSLMAKGQVNKGKTNKPKLSVKEKKAKKNEKRAAKRG